MPERLISLFEHQPRSYAETGLAGLPAARRERLLREIERLNERSGQEILHLGRREIRAGSLVGMVRAGEFTFEILPKIDCPPADHPAREDAAPPLAGPAHRQAVQSAARNLLSMLSYAYDLQIYAQDLAGVDTQSGSWIEPLTRLFAVGLYRQILSGLSQTYTVQEESLPVLRGRWDVQRQILRHAHARQTFDVIYDEYSADIPLNQVFRFVIERLHMLSQDAENRLLLSDLQEWFTGVTRLPRVTPDFLDGIHFTRLNERFQPAFNLARLFLSASVIQLSAGRLPAMAFVMDMDALFERFTAAFLARYRQRIFPVAWQDASLLAQSAGQPVYLARSGDRPVLRLRPDLLFTHPGQPAPLLVADTKYKLLDSAQRRSGPDPDDAYQMLAYAVRLGCPRALLLYPQPPTGGPLRKRYEIQSANLQLFAATLNLRVPLEPPDGLVKEAREILDFCAGQPADG